MTYKKTHEVDFFSGGDTVRDAFRKHIQEFDNVYGALNALDNEKASIEELENKETELKELLSDHCSDSKAHQNINLSNYTGTFPAGQVVGVLTGAEIYASRVKEFNLAVQNALGLANLDDLQDIESGSIQAEKLEENGYIKLGNGLILQWGKAEIPNSHEDGFVIGINFPIGFTTQCFVVNVSVDSPFSNREAASASVVGDYIGLTRFSSRIYGAYGGKVSYFAIGV